MNNLLCPVCGENDLIGKSETDNMSFQGGIISYATEFFLCSACGTEITTPHQSKRNKRAIIAAKREALQLPSPEGLKAWRKYWGLTQERAGQLLGVGPVAFSKYENADMLPSLPTARLLYLVTSLPSATKALSKRFHIQLNPAPAEKMPPQAEGSFVEILMASTTITTTWAANITEVDSFERYQAVRHYPESGERHHATYH